MECVIPGQSIFTKANKPMISPFAYVHIILLYMSAIVFCPAFICVCIESARGSRMGFIKRGSRMANVKSVNSYDWAINGVYMKGKIKQLDHRFGRSM